MLSIGDLFGKIKNLQAREISFRTSVCASVKKHTGIQLEIESVVYSKGKITLKNLSHSAKSLVFMKKGAILSEVNALQDVHQVKDIG